MWQQQNHSVKYHQSNFWRPVSHHSPGWKSCWTRLSTYFVCYLCKTCFSVSAHINTHRISNSPNNSVLQSSILHWSFSRISSNYWLLKPAASSHHLLFIHSFIQLGSGLELVAVRYESYWVDLWAEMLFQVGLNCIYKLKTTPTKQKWNKNLTSKVCLSSQKWWKCSFKVNLLCRGFVNSDF